METLDEKTLGDGNFDAGIGQASSEFLPSSVYFFPSHKSAYY